MEIAFALVAGLLLGWFLRPRKDDSFLKENLARFQSDNARLIGDNAALRTRLAETENIRESMNKEFKAVTADLLEYQKRSVAEEQVKTILPVRQEMDKLKESFDKQVREMLESGVKNKVSLEEQLKFLRESAGSLQKEAADLSNALKHKKLQGNWGEFQLEKIFEILGFVEGREYSKEVFVRSEDGAAVRPDYVLNLPDSRRVIIDSKLSLESYMKYVNAVDDAEKKKFIKEFVAATKKHIDILGSKEYQNKLKDSSLDYVFMFMPLEHSYLAALEEDPELYQYSFKNNVALATPSLLFPMMRTIDTILKIDKRDKNIDEVVEMVNKLYEKYIGFTENFSDVGKRLESAQNSYKTALGQLSDGNGNISGWMDKIRKKSGIMSNKKIPIEFSGKNDE